MEITDHQKTIVYEALSILYDRLIGGPDSRVEFEFKPGSREHDEYTEQVGDVLALGWIPRAMNEIIATVVWVVGNDTHETNIVAALTHEEIKLLDRTIEKWEVGSTCWTELQHSTPLTEEEAASIAEELQYPKRATIFPNHIIGLQAVQKAIKAAIYKGPEIGP